jgi:hypothetical protein
VFVFTGLFRPRLDFKRSREVRPERWQITCTADCTSLEIQQAGVANQEKNENNFTS